MANRHFGTLADVWKHLVLAEVLRGERPARYAETHAGSAVYPMVDDAERRFGVRHAAAAMRSCTYLDVARPYLADGTYPGSATIAMSICPSAQMLLCDTDPVSAASLREHAGRLGAHDVEVTTDDGMLAVGAWLRDGPALGPSTGTVVHVDPYDPWAGTPSALDLAAGVLDAGHGLVYWYGYDEPDERTWAIAELRRPDLWCGDMLVTTAEGTVENEGDLADATTPGTGCGVLLAGVGSGVARRCEQLGEALVAAYAGAPLPDGRAGGLDFLVDIT